MKPLYASLWLAFCFFSARCAARVDDYFNPAALEYSSDQHNAADLHYFAREGGQQPGTYHVTLLLNNRLMDSRDVTIGQGYRSLKVSECR